MQVFFSPLYDQRENMNEQHLKYFSTDPQRDVESNPVIHYDTDHKIHLKCSGELFKGAVKSSDHDQDAKQSTVANYRNCLT